MIDIETILSENNVNFTTKGKHGRKGWVQIKCPFCGGGSGHPGGFNIDKAYYNCYRCGYHWLPKVISEIANVSIRRAKEIIKANSTIDYKEEKEETKLAESLVYPVKTGPMKKSHKEYLHKRNFDPEKLERKFELLGTGNIGKYKNRILAPIRYKTKLISYQTRDITDKHPAKYMACEQTKEVYPHKDILYGIDHCNRPNIVLVEGISDVWRLGYGAAGFSGIDFSTKQMLLISKKYKEVFIFFDDEDTAQSRAERLFYELQAMGLTCENIINDGGDPGDLTDEEADEFMKGL